MVTFFSFMVVGLFVGVLGYYLLKCVNCSKVLSVILLTLGLSTFIVSTLGAVIDAGYTTGRQSVINEQNEKELMEKQEVLIEELGLTQEQLELLRR